MNTSSHILMGGFLQQYMGDHYGIRLDRRSYILGNVMPDYCPSFLLRPHYLRNNAAHVRSILRILLARRPSAFDDKRYSRLLGILCHFYADFFCHAHSDSFEGNLSDHIAYEKKLHRYFEENLERFRSLRFIAQPQPVGGAEGVYGQFEALHSCYLLSRTSLGNDLLFTMTACVELIVLAAECTAPAAAYHFDNLAAV